MPTSPLQGRTVLVTGAGRRLGRALAEGVVAAGADTILLAHQSLDGAHAVAAAARAAGLRSEALGVDLSDRADTDRALDVAFELAGGRLDAVVHAAASFEPGTLDQTDDALWDRVVELNLTAPFRIARRLAPVLAQSPVGGSIVLVADLAAFLPFPGRFAHSVAKGGVVSLTRALARALAPAVRVNAVAPGVSLPPDDLSGEERAAAYERVPMGDAGGAAEVVRAVLHLLGSTHVTGEVLRVDGGRSLR